MRNRETKEFLVLREELNNPDFKPVEFDGFRKETQCGEMIKCIYPWTPARRLVIFGQTVMNEIKIIEVLPEEIPALAELAAEIWRQHFPPIIGAEMVEYMLEKFQSEAAIRRQTTEEGVHYYFIKHDGQTAGYMAIRPEPESLFLSKIYLRQAFRGKRLSRAAIDFLVAYCREHRLGKIWLTVNRFNLEPIAAYEKMGFRKDRTQCVDVGRGFFMDDYVMVKDIPVEPSV